MLKGLLITILLASCGDNLVPPPDATEPQTDGVDPFSARTWGDAEEVWAEGWCLYAARCRPDLFDLVYGDHDSCVAEVTAENCRRREESSYLERCDDPYYRHLLRDLNTCYEEMRAIECTATDAPDSCYAAFEED